MDFFFSLPSRSFLPLVFSSWAFSLSCFCSKGFFLEFNSFFLPITTMDNTVVEGLSNLRLTKEEEEEIPSSQGANLTYWRSVRSAYLGDS